MGELTPIYDALKNNGVGIISPGNSTVYYPVGIPSDLRTVYNFDGCDFAVGETNEGGSITATSLTAKQIFAKYSVAQSSPQAIIYVSTTGNDSTGTGTITAPYLTINKAITVANSGGVSTKIYVKSGTYYRSSSPAYPSNTTPTVDIALIAYQGRVITGTFDAFSAPSHDVTYTNTYSYARSSVNRVFDIANLDQYGHYKELTLVTSAAICNITPGSWYTDGVTLYINRADGAAVTNSNTRVYLQAAVLLTGTNVNLYIGNEDGYSGFDFESGVTGSMNATYASPTTSKKIIVAENSTFRYSGGRSDSIGRGVALDSFYGWGWFFNCDASHNMTDGFNCHNTYSATATGIITINSTGVNNGIAPNASLSQQSNNGWTSHDNCVGADFSGYYLNNRGGTCRSINTSVSLLAGTIAKNDLGDLAAGGASIPTAYQTDNTAKYYCFRTKADVSGGQIAYIATGTSTIYQRDVWPTRGITGNSGGTIGTY